MTHERHETTGKAIDFAFPHQPGGTMDAIADYIRTNWPSDRSLHLVHIHKGGEGDPLVVHIPGMEPREFPAPSYPEES